MKALRIFVIAFELGIVTLLSLWVYHWFVHEKFHILTSEQIDNVEIIIVGTIISVIVERLMGRLIDLFGRKK